MAKFTVSYNLVAVDKISNVTKKISNNLQKTAKKFKKLGNDAEVAGKKSERAARRIALSNKIAKGGFNSLASSLRGYVLAAGAAFAASRVLTKGMAFEDQLADLSAITGASGEKLNFLADESLRLSKVSKISAAEVAESFKLIASAKDELLDNPKALSNITEQALLLSNASGVDLATSSKTLATSLNQFGAEADQAAHFVDVMAAAAKFGASEIDETAIALIKAGPAAKVAGVSFRDTNALIQALAKGGLKGAIAGTGLNSTLLRMQKIGIDFKKVSIEEAFTKVGDALNAIQDPAERTNVLMKSFGLENVKTVETLIKQSATLGELSNKLRQTGIAQEQANIRTATFSKSWKLLGIVLDEKMIKLFDKIKPRLSEMTDGMIEFLESIDESAIDSLASSIAVLVDALALVGKVGLGAIAVLKGVGTFAGASLARLQAQQDLGERSEGFFNYGSQEELAALDREFERSTAGAFDIGGKFLGSFDLPQERTAGGVEGIKETIDVNINLSGQTDNVDSVKTKSTGRKVKSKTNMAGNN